MIFEKVKKKQHIKRGLLLGMVLGMVAQSMATSVSNTDGATSTATTTHEATIEKTVQVLGFSVGSGGDANGKDFSVTFSDEDISKLAAYRTLGGTYATDLASATTDIWVPIASTEVCVVSNNAVGDSTNMLQAAAVINDLEDTSNSYTLKTAVALKGNGNVTAAGSSQYVFVCGSSCATNNKFLTTNVITDGLSAAGGGSTIGSLDSTYSNSVSTNIWGMGNDPLASAASGTANVMKFDHANTVTNSNAYGLSFTGAVNTGSTAYTLDKTAFDADQCGTGNANAVRVIVFASLEDIISNPATTYAGNVQLDFNRAT
ncbi:MAG: hypothetical protein VX737_05285 [Pseudomonadota bacterium]|nr:hypothetical protein [Pseudomonadota bacterium]